MGKEYENLITVDLICHGTPPMKYLNEHIEKAVKGKKFDSFAFRGKYDYCLAVYSGNKKLYKEYKDNDEYFTAFLKSMILRNNCYKCKYARPERVSDITIGDFWGINRDTLKNKYEGRISLVMPNTEKGDVFFKSCKDMLVYEVRKLDEALNPAQGNLLHPSVSHIKREVFIQNYPKYGFEKAIYMTGIGEEVRKKRIKHKVTRPIRLIKKISAKIKRKI